MTDKLSTTEIRDLPLHDRMKLFRDEAKELVQEAHEQDREDFERLIVVAERLYTAASLEAIRKIGLIRNDIQERIDKRGNSSSWKTLETFNVVEAVYFANELGKLSS